MSDALIGALVGGLVATLGFWITFKTSTAAMQKAMAQNAAIKQAEFRQQWISQLRSCLADFISAGENLVHANTQLIRQDQFADFLSKKSIMLLFLTSSEEKFSELRKCIDYYTDITTQGKHASGDTHHAARMQLIEATRKVLKAEWEVIKTEIKST